MTENLKHADFLEETDYPNIVSSMDLWFLIYIDDKYEYVIFGY